MVLVLALWRLGSSLPISACPSPLALQHSLLRYESKNGQDYSLSISSPVRCHHRRSANGSLHSPTPQISHGLGQGKVRSRSNSNVEDATCNAAAESQNLQSARAADEGKSAKRVRVLP